MLNPAVASSPLLNSGRSPYRPARLSMSVVKSADDVEYSGGDRGSQELSPLWPPMNGSTQSDQNRLSRSVNSGTALGEEGETLPSPKEERSGVTVSTDLEPSSTEGTIEGVEELEDGAVRGEGQNDPNELLSSMDFYRGGTTNAVLTPDSTVQKPSPSQVRVDETPLTGKEEGKEENRTQETVEQTGDVTNASDSLPLEGPEESVSPSSPAGSSRLSRRASLPASIGSKRVKDSFESQASGQMRLLGGQDGHLGGSTNNLPNQGRPSSSTSSSMEKAALRDAINDSISSPFNTSTHPFRSSDNDDVEDLQFRLEEALSEAAVASVCSHITTFLFTSLFLALNLSLVQLLLLLLLQLRAQFIPRFTHSPSLPHPSLRLHHCLYPL